MAHPTRSQLAKRLGSRLGISITWDEQNDVWDTGRRALLAHDPDATHHLVLQDDAVAHRGLVSECKRLLEHTPGDVPVSLYMGKARHRPRRFPMKSVVEAAKTHRASFAVFGGPWWGVGIILPTSHIESVVEFGDQPQRHRNYDIRIAQYYASKGIDCWYTMPCLVDHRAGQSIVGRRGARRHAVWPPKRLGLDWSRGIVTPADMKLSQRFPKTP